MAINIKKIKDVSELSDEQLHLFGIGSTSFFLKSRDDVNNFAILTEKKVEDDIVDNLVNGLVRNNIFILISQDIALNPNNNVRGAFLRDLMNRIFAVKGLTLKDKNVIYSVPSSVLEHLYKEHIDKLRIDNESNSKVQKIIFGNGDLKRDVEEETSTEAINNFFNFSRMSYEKGASDIHFLLKKEENVCSVQARINGEMTELQEVPYSAGIAMCRAAYTWKADSNSRSHTGFNENQRQDARVVVNIDDIRFALRYASAPTSLGSNIVMRILPLSDDNAPKELRNSGFLDSQVLMLESIMRKPIGALVIAGVTGSGKSTTMKVMLTNYIEQNPQKKIITIEQPVEYPIPGAVQIPVIPNDSEEENPYSGTIKASMRLDPDTIMIGEVRDDITATLLASATESGHSVITTVHASSALEVITRLTGQAMKLPIETVSSLNFIAGLVYQKLIPILCEHCKVPLDQNKILDNGNSRDLAFLSRLQMVCDLSEHSIFVRSDNGCPHCNGRGVSGREVCAEVIVPDLKMRAYWKSNDDVGAYQHWRSTNNKNEPLNGQGKTALEIAIYKMTLGIVSPYDIEADFGDINEDYVMEDGVRLSEEISYGN